MSATRVTPAAADGLLLTVRPDAMRRCLANLVGNGQRYAPTISVAAVA
jgi:hypothetical protein